MKNKKSMTIDQHREIAKWITDPIAIKMACAIPNTYGKTSRAGQYAQKVYDAILHLKSEMENMAYADGLSELATDLYYPQRKAISNDVESPDQCKRCRSEMKPGIAIQSTLAGSPDMGEIVTLNYGGPGRLVDCVKCPECGYSQTD